MNKTVLAELTIEDLRNKAIRRYLDKTDWDIYDFLDKKEALKFAKAELIVGDIEEELYKDIIKNIKQTRYE